MYLTGCRKTWGSEHFKLGQNLPSQVQSSYQGVKRRKRGWEPLGNVEVLSGNEVLLRSVLPLKGIACFSLNGKLNGKWGLIFLLILPHLEPNEDVD